MPRGRQRRGLGFAVAHHHRHDQIRIVVDCTERVRHAVAQLPSFVDGARHLRRAMAADAAGEGEFLEELAHALGVLALVRIDLAVAALQIYRGQHAGRTVSGTGYEDRIQIVFDDQPVHVDVGEGQTGTGTPVAEQTALDVLRLERFPEQGVVAQIDHAGCEIVAGAPVGINSFDIIGRQWGGGDVQDRSFT